MNFNLLSLDFVIAKMLEYSNFSIKFMAANFYLNSFAPNRFIPSITFKSELKFSFESGYSQSKSMPSKLYLRKKAIEEFMKIARAVELKDQKIGRIKLPLGTLRSFH